MFADGVAIAGEDEAGPDLGEGLEDEAAVGHPRVGDDEEGVVDDELVEVEDVDVDDAGGVALADGLAAEVVFDALGVLVEAVGVADVVEFDDGVVEVGGAGRALERVGLVDGRLFVVHPDGGEAAEELAGFPEVGEAIAEIGAEGESDARRHGCTGEAFRGRGLIWEREAAGGAGVISGRGRPACRRGRGVARSTRGRRGPPRPRS